MARHVARNSLLSALASLATTLAAAGGTVIVARSLGVEHTGVVTLALWLVTIAVTLASLGLPTAMTLYVAEAQDDATQQGLARRFLWPTLASAGVAFVVFAVAASVLWTGATDVVWTVFAGEDLRTRIAIWFVLGTATTLQVLGQYHIGVLRGRQDFRSAANITICACVVQMAATLGGCLTFGILGALVGYALGAVPAAISCIVLRGEGGALTVEMVARVRRFALYAWAGAVMSAFVWARIEIYFLQRFEGFEAVGLFTAGLTLASLATQGPLLLSGALLPHFADAHARGALDHLREAYASATRLVAFLAFPAGLGLAAIMPVIIPLVFGEAFRPAVPVASLLVVASALGAASVVGTHLVNALERSDFIFYSSLCGAVLAVVAGFTLVPAFGLMGAGAARALIQFAMVAAGLWFITSRLGYRAPLRDLAKLFLAAGLAALGARLCLILISGRWSLAAAILAAVVVYVVGVRTFRALTSKDIDRLRNAVSLLPAPLNLCGWPVLLLIRT